MLMPDHIAGAVPQRAMVREPLHGNGMGGRLGRAGGIAVSALWRSCDIRRAPPPRGRRGRFGAGRPGRPFGGSVSAPCNEAGPWGPASCAERELPQLLVTVWVNPELLVQMTLVPTVMFLDGNAAVVVMLMFSSAPTAPAVTVTVPVITLWWIQ